MTFYLAGILITHFILILFVTIDLRGLYLFNHFGFFKSTGAIVIISALWPIAILSLIAGYIRVKRKSH